jgi:hypothetical protein
MSDLAFVPADRLEEAWSALRDNIRRREAELAALKHEFQILDEARALLIMRAGAGDSPVSFDSNKTKVGLREAVLACVRESELGIGFADLCTAVMRQVGSERYSTERSLVAAVQTTLRRLIAQGEVSLFMREGARKYVIGSSVESSDKTPRNRKMTY